MQQDFVVQLGLGSSAVAGAWAWWKEIFEKGGGIQNFLFMTYVNHDKLRPTAAKILAFFSVQNIFLNTFV